ncbi:hydrogenase maturation protease [Saccharopolyspora rectivirgula]|jgi:hydrogenase maturation protease|uniref:hydrogenase maturation protease n=1 Tax=Saccharopolyspora rectivirgula TaxID=28042 RepID=UPI00040D8B28|nr:hydrogenase maturation protease [Saccharopolyspora rectivirgula]
MSKQVLVAGVGNVFLGDDGFGVEVVNRLLDQSLPDWVQVTDYGIRGVHLAYELLEDYQVLIIVDALPRGGAPGTLYVVEPDLDEDFSNPQPTAALDGHGMNPEAVLGLCKTLGARVSRALVVGCEPEDCSPGMRLSEPVAAAVAPAVDVVRDLLADVHGSLVAARSDESGMRRSDRRLKVTAPACPGSQRPHAPDPGRGDT